MQNITANIWVAGRMGQNDLVGIYMHVYALYAVLKIAMIVALTLC